MSGEILQSQIVKPKSWISQEWAKYKLSIGYIAGFVLSFKVWNILVIGKTINSNFFVSQVGFFILGVAHFFLFYWIMPWANKKNLKPIKECLFILLMLGLANILFYVNFGKNVFLKGDPNLAPSVIPFIIPFLIMKAWDFWEAVPERLYKTWQYPVGMKPPIIQPQGGALTLNFKIDTVKEGTRFKEPFPYQMDLDKTLGDHLHFYLFQHNAKYTGDKTILISDPATNSSYNWSFCTYNVLQRIFGGSTVLDFSVPIKNLNLKTGTLIEVQNN